VSCLSVTWDAGYTAPIRTKMKPALQRIGQTWNATHNRIPSSSFWHITCEETNQPSLCFVQLMCIVHVTINNDMRSDNGKTLLLHKSMLLQESCKLYLILCYCKFEVMFQFPRRPALATAATGRNGAQSTTAGKLYAWGASPIQLQGISLQIDAPGGCAAAICIMKLTPHPTPQHPASQQPGLLQLATSPDQNSH
jgi:hypothetical protein